MAKLHWSEGKRPGDTLWVTLCGQLEVAVANRPDDVTCKKCLRTLRDMQPRTDAADYVDTLLDDEYPRPVAEYRRDEWTEPPPLFDPISGLPAVSRETWPTLRSRHHYCARCPVCVYFIELEADAHARPWAKRHAETSGFRWVSAAHALEWFYHVRLDGYSMGTLGEALSKLGRLGTRVTSSGSGDQQKAFEEAQDAVLVERALGQCYQGRSRRGLSRSDRFRCLFGVTVFGEKPHVVARKLRETDPANATLTGPSVSQIAARGRDEVYWYLRQFELVPRRAMAG